MPKRAKTDRKRIEDGEFVNLMETDTKKYALKGDIALSELHTVGRNINGI